MATGGWASPSSYEDRRLTCALCMDIFTQPKLLPCHHCFCCKCLENLASQLPSTDLSCPTCRSKVTVPAGGVSQFQNNFYLRPEDLDLVREGAHCATHHEQPLDLFCGDCDVAVCLKCVLTKHKPHMVQDLSEAVTEARQQLSQDDRRLQKVMSRTTEEVEAEKREQQSLQDKKAAVETLIRERHATAVALTDKCRDELLARVGTVCRPLEEEVDTALTARTNVLRHLCQLQQQLQQTLTDDSACTLLTMAKEMREGKGSAQALENRTPAKRSTITCPVLSFPETSDTFKENVHNYFGTVETVAVDIVCTEIKVEEMFDCKKEEDTEVFSLCPLDDGTVWVSFAHCGLQKNAAADLFQENGKQIRSCDKCLGKASQKCTGNGSTVFMKSSDSVINTYSKSISSGHNYLKVYNELKGQADILKDTEKSKKGTKKKKSVKLFTINVGPHRAFDADSREQFFVVVEEAQAPDQPRQVKLYQRNKPDAVATYTPPSKPFNPSDVSFFSLGGKEVLMIADQVGDSVHVVHVQDGRMTFVRHASPGCPLLVQPIALNTDHKGRLWVACRRGSILTMTPVVNGSIERPCKPPLSCEPTDSLQGHVTGTESCQEGCDETCGPQAEEP